MGEPPAKHCPLLTPVAASTAPTQGPASHALVASAFSLLVAKVPLL